MGDNPAAGSDANDRPQSTSPYSSRGNPQRRVQVELHQVNGSSSAVDPAAALGAMEEGKVCTNVYLHEKEPHKDSCKVSNYRKVAAEAISTFILVFLGCGSIIADKKSGGSITPVGISLAFGLVIMAMIRAVGHISGAHMNPGITIAFASVGDFPWTLVPFYIVAQVGGAICAGFALRLMFDYDLNHEDLNHLGATSPAYSNLQAVFMEFIITLVLMFVVMSVAVDSKAVGELAALILGLTITLGAIVGGPISGASMNSARSIGPAVAAHWYKGLWVYIAGPIPGAVVGAWLYVLLHGPQHLPSESQVRIKPRQGKHRRLPLWHKREPVSYVEEKAVTGETSLQIVDGLVGPLCPS